MAARITDKQIMAVSKSNCNVFVFIDLRAPGDAI